MMEPNVRVETNERGFCFRHFEMIANNGKRHPTALIIQSHLEEITSSIKKKKGIAGWFGGKRSVQVFEPSKGLQDLNEKLIAMQEERERRIDMYTDSLRIQNKALNRKLQILITHLDGQAQAAFISREEKITEAGDFSFKLFVLVLRSWSTSRPVLAW